MKKALPALFLALLLLLTACGAPAQPDTGNDGQSEVTAAALPEAILPFYDCGENSGTAEGFPLAERAYEGVSSIYGVRMPNGLYSDLILKDFQQGVKLENFSNGGAHQEGGYARLSWNGEMYNAFTIAADSCPIPSLNPIDGGMLRLNITGDCVINGGGEELECLNGFACVLISGSGSLTFENTSGIVCGGTDFDLPAIIIDGDVDVYCSNIELLANESDAPSLVILGGSLRTDSLTTESGIFVGGGTLACHYLRGGGRCIFRDGIALIDRVEEGPPMEVILSGGICYLADAMPDGTKILAGPGTFWASRIDDLDITDYGGTVADGETLASPYFSMAYSVDWAPSGEGTGMTYDSLHLTELDGRYFFGRLNLENAAADSLDAWGAMELNLLSDSSAGHLGAAGILFTGEGTMSCGGINIWGYGGYHAPVLALEDGVSVSVHGGGDTSEEVLTIGSNAEERALLLADGGVLHIDGSVWLQNADLKITDGEVHITGSLSMERGSVEISGGTVTLDKGLWLGEGDILITGGTVIVPGGESSLAAENGRLIVSCGTVTEP